MKRIIYRYRHKRRKDTTTSLTVLCDEDNCWIHSIEKSLPAHYKGMDPQDVLHHIHRVGWILIGVSDDEEVHLRGGLIYHGPTPEYLLNEVSSR